MKSGFGCEENGPRARREEFPARRGKCSRGGGDVSVDIGRARVGRVANDSFKTSLRRNFAGTPREAGPDDVSAAARRSRLGGNAAMNASTEARPLTPLRKRSDDASAEAR